MLAGWAGAAPGRYGMSATSAITVSAGGAPKSTIEASQATRGPERAGAIELEIAAPSAFTPGRARPAPGAGSAG